MSISVEESVKDIDILGPNRPLKIKTRIEALGGAHKGQFRIYIDVIEDISLNSSFIYGLYNADIQEVYISSIQISPKLRRRGIATKLLDEFTATVKKMGAKTLTANLLNEEIIEVFAKKFGPDNLGIDYKETKRKIKKSFFRTAEVVVDLDKI